MADPITREQVERAIEAARAEGSMQLDEALLEWYERSPSYVREAWRVPGWEAFRAALTRWRDELAAAEPVRRVARWDASHVAYALAPPYETEQRDIGRGDHTNGRTVATPDREKAIAWGYEIEGGPEPTPAEDSPERLRERRERLGWSLDEARDAIMVLSGAQGMWWLSKDVAACEAPGPQGSRHVRYAAALSAEEARLAKLAAERDAHAVPRLGWLEPERPAPRFKVGDWAADDRGEHGQISRAEWSATQVQWRYVMGSVDYPERDLEPTCAPVVTVPQSVVKQHLGIECQWDPGDDHVTLVEPDRGVGLPASLALLRAMLEAIDAQQGGAS